MTNRYSLPNNERCIPGDMQISGIWFPNVPYIENKIYLLTSMNMAMVMHWNFMLVLGV